MLLTLLCDGLRFLFLCLRPSPALAAENLFLRKQLALYQERYAKPRRVTNTTRRILHTNVTAHPTAQWRLQQLREAILSDHNYGFLIHDGGIIFSREFDQSVHNFGLQVHRTPVQSPKANAICERLLGMLRRECLDFVIPLTEDHCRRVLKDWVRHYNAGRPHMALGPGIPRPPSSRPGPLHAHRHRLPEHLRLVAR
jgi:putative transposase